MSNIVFTQLDEFIKEFKKISKKIPSLDEDLELLKRFLTEKPDWYLNNIVQISNLWEEIVIPIYKVRKFACKYLKDNKSIRLIYAYKKDSNCIDLIEIEMVEIYQKNQKDNHNIERIIKYYWNNQ